MTATSLEPREHSDDEVRALAEERQPHPFEPLPYDAPARAQGQGHVRRSLAGDRWCPYCQTPLSGTRQSCTRCHPIRQDLVATGRLQQPSNDSQPAQTDQAITQLLNAVDEMARVVALASAHQHNGRRLGKQQIDDMFMASKEVMVLADQLRRERDGNP
ncbi:hypothetical protein [Microbacterium sp.]|uniref:hypothetical protein n=1 Tax=Microbacterium sp. TaxID=51671 RepID=UPI0027366B8B|nr:hypothetical protein [Microbacterium sp.]MDP3950820.1 hypothetical protein [Microbacterium sp.]